MHSTLLLFLAGVIGVSAASQPSSVRMTLTVPAAITLGEPVAPVLMIQNTSDEDIVADLGDDRLGNFTVNMDCPDGTRRQSAFTVGGGVRRTSTVRVSARSAYKQQLLLNEVLPVNEVGKYEGTAGFSGEIRAASGLALNWPREFQVSFVISERDESVLRRSFSQLALATRGTAQQLDAMRALSYVRDPIVVPYLRDVLINSKAHAFAVLHTLAKIGSDEALQILENTAREDSQPGEIARDALSRLKR